MENQISQVLKRRIADRAEKIEKKAIMGLPEKEVPFNRIIHDPTKYFKPKSSSSTDSHGGKKSY